MDAWFVGIHKIPKKKLILIFSFSISGMHLTVSYKLFAKPEIIGNRTDWLLFHFYTKLTLISQLNFISVKPRSHPQVNFINLHRTYTAQKRSFRKVFPFPQTPHLCLLISPVFNLAAIYSRSKSCITHQKNFGWKSFSLKASSTSTRCIRTR